jgi:phage RecT family recombinase
MTSIATVPAMTAGEKLVATVEKYEEQIKGLAPRGVAPSHYYASLRLYLAANPKVLECTPASVAVGILRVAQTGLDLGVSCDLLPFGSSCQFSPRYNGIIELALASGVRAVNADVVREGEILEAQKGTEFYLRHRKYGPDGKPLAVKGAAITMAYAIAEIKQGSFVFETLTREEIDAIRAKYSQQWKRGSLDEIPWYAKKTMVRRLSPYLPKNSRFAAALQYADTVDEVLEGEFEVVDRETGEITEKTEAELF